MERLREMYDIIPPRIRVGIALIGISFALYFSPVEVHQIGSFGIQPIEERSGVDPIELDRILALEGYSTPVSDIMHPQIVYPAAVEIASHKIIVSPENPELVSEAP